MRVLPTMFAIVATLMVVLAPVSQAVAQEKPKVEVVPWVAHSATVTSVAFAPNGRHFLSGSRDSTLKLWDAATGMLVRTLRGHTEKIHSVAFSPTGREVLSASEDKTLKLWNAATGRLLRTFEMNSWFACPVAFSPDGQQILSGGDDQVLSLWDASTGLLLRTFQGHSNRVNSITFSPDGRQIVSGSADHTLKLWDAVTGQLLHTFEGHSDEVNSVAVSPDGRHVVSGSRDKTLRLWDLLSGKGVKILEADSNWVGSVSFSPDGRILLSNGGDWALKLWDVESGKLLRTMEADIVKRGGELARRFLTRVGTASGVHATAAFSPDGQLIIANDWLAGLELWDVATGRLVRATRSTTTLPVSSAQISIGGSQVLSRHDRKARIWDISSGRLKRTFDEVLAASWSPDGRQLLFAGRDGALRLLDATTSDSVRTFEAQSKSQPSWIASVAFSSDGRRVLAIDSKKAISVWDATSGPFLRTITLSPNAPGCAVFSQDGSLLLAADHEAVKLWNVDSGELVRSYPYGYSRSELMYSCAFSPDGKKVLAAGSRLRMWDTESGSLLHNFEADAEVVKEASGWVHAFEARSYAIEAVAFLPEGHRFLAGDSDGTLKLWDASTGRLLRILEKHHHGSITSIHLAPDGRRALSAARDGTMRIWNLDPNSLAASIFVTHKDEWVLSTPEGFFAGSGENTDRLISVVKGLDLTTIDQVHQSLFNPDLVRAALAGDPDAEVSNAAKIVNLEKVLNSGPAPTVAILSHVEGSQSKSDVVTVQARVIDRGKGIGRIEWRVNGVTAAVGANKPYGPGPDYTLSEDLVLDPGDNTIEVVAYNRSNLLASLAARTTIKFTGGAGPSKPRLHILAIGIDKYESIGRLNYAVKDAKAFAAAMKEAGTGLYAEVKVTSVFDEQATRDNLDKVVTDIARDIHPRDTFILFAAAHGDSDKGRFYLIPQNYHGGKDHYADRAISQDHLQDWLANRIKARKALILLDTCESGAVTAGHLRSRTDGPASEAGVGRLHEATGRPVLTASALGQFAWEGVRGPSGEYHGVFTSALLDALRNADTNGNQRIELSELVNHVQTHVPKLAAQLGGSAIAKSAVAGSSTSSDHKQSARFGSRGEDFVIARRLQ